MKSSEFLWFFRSSWKHCAMTALQCNLIVTVLAVRSLAELPSTLLWLYPHHNDYLLKMFIMVHLDMSVRLIKAI